MVSFVPKDNKLFTSIFDTASNVLEIGMLNVKSDGLYLSGMDLSHVSFIKIEISEDDFETYNYTQDIGLGINIKEFVKILKCSSDKDKIEISCCNIEESTTTNLQIKFCGSGINRKYSLKLLYIDEDEIDVPDMDYPMEFEMRSKLFNNLINSITVIDGDYIKFNVKDQKLTLESNSDTSELNIEILKEVRNVEKNILKKQDNKFVTKKVMQKEYELYSCEGNFTSTITLNFIKLISKAFTISPFVLCHVAPSSPLRMDFMLNDAGTSIQYYVSPKLDD